MIDTLSVSGVATYPDTPAILDGFAFINFLYGSNGSGKTTLSKLIADEGAFPTCKVTWKGGIQLRPAVYNRDFVQSHFNQSSELKGIFTLGKKNVEMMKAIEEAKKELDAFDKALTDLKAAVEGDDGQGGKRDELRVLEEDFKTKCWTIYTKHKAKLGSAFDGFRNSKENFRDKVVKENTENKSTVQTQEFLEQRALTVFGPAPAVEPVVPVFDGSKLLSYESDPILKKRVIGKEDVDIAAMIKKLGNSDWVQSGRTYYEINDAFCPFCQQKTDGSLTKSLNDYFDESFVNDSKAIEALGTNYSTEVSRLQQQLNGIIASPSRFLKLEAFKIEKELFDSRIAVNLQKIATKKKEPSQLVELDSINNVLTGINALLDAARKAVHEHNKTVANLAQEKRDLTGEVWKLIVDTELKEDLATYLGKRTGLQKAIGNLESKIAAASTNKAKKAAEIRTLEKDATSIQPTVNAINVMLLSFGFHGFSLAVSEKGSSYVILRPNGKDAKDTLSEGEKTFITFLYFFHLLRGSTTETGVTENRIVVFDDPVSSLDSDILFIVGTLIKSLYVDVKEGRGDVKQVFVLTHNIYFHKEVTFHQNHKLFGPNDVTYWTVRKSGLVSKVTKCVGNPVRTGYELLWLEVRKGDRNNLSIQNSLRRILESYFKILGNCDFDTICGYFSGDEQKVCRSLFAWINDGSHSALDDLYASTDSSMVEMYLHVFRSIFDKTNNIGHYKMMMGEDYVETAKPLATATTPSNN